MFPHLIGILFDGSSRGHDHWEYLLKLAATKPREIELAAAAVFGFTQASATATAGQGMPIKWSTSAQVVEINEFLKRVNFKTIAEKFAGFPLDPPLYKPRSDDELQTRLYEIAEIREFYDRAAENKLAAIAVLD